MNCRKCGAFLNVGDKFCPNCGEKVNIINNNQNLTANNGSMYNQNYNKSNDNKKYILIILVIAFMLIGIGGYFIIYNKNNKPSTDIDDFIQNYEDELKKKEEELNKNYVVLDEIILANGDILVKLKNNNNEPVFIDGTIKFYDSNGRIIDQTSVFFPSGVDKNSIVYGYVYVYEKYDTYKLEIKLQTPLYTEIYDDKIDIDINNTGEEIEVTATNNSGASVDYLRLAILYYDANNKIIGYDDTLLSALNNGESTIKRFSFPRNEDYKLIDFSKYEVVVNAGK